MATYVNDLRLKEIATGDESGTWGTSTNTNLSLIADAFSYATKDCFATDADATETMADGSADEIRSLYLKVTSSATLTATRTLTLAPNTVSKVWIIENATTGGQSITISQGSGSNVTIPSGHVKVVYTDGGGATAAVTDAFTDLNLSGNLNVDGSTFVVDGTNNRVGLGTASPSYRLSLVDTTQSGTTIQLFRTGQAAGSIFINNGISFGSDGGNGDTERMTINFSTGNVGIGTTNPNGKLTISNSGAGGLEFTPDTTSFSVANSNYIASYDRTALAYRDIVFDLGGAENQSIRFKTGGYLGIGTSSPDYNLSVGKVGTAANSYIQIGTTTTGAGNLFFGDTSGTGTGSYSGYVQYDHNVDAMILGTASTERLRINSSGYVGIGTSSPASKLHITGTGTYNHTPGQNTTSDFIITSSEMTDNNYHSIMQLVSVRQSLATGSGANGYIGFSTIDDSNAQGVRDAGRIAIVNENGTARNSSTALSFWTNAGGTDTTAATEKMRIDSLGNVGIGTSSPANYSTYTTLNVGQNTVGSILQLNGATSSNYHLVQNNDGAMLISADASNTGASSVMIFQTGGTERMRIESDGEVAVGTTTVGTSILSYKRNISAPNTGLNVTENSTYNDGSVHNFGTRANCCGMIIIKSEGGPDGVGYIPFWTNGGGGVNYEWTALNPDTSALTGSSVSFNLGGSSGLDFTVSFAGGSGIISVQRTAGSVLYRVVIMEFFSG